MTANIHIDCDPLWVYASEYGEAPDYTDARIYEESLPRLAELLEAWGLRGTFFLIGREVQLPACRRFVERALRAGHEIANHTQSHLQDLDSAGDEMRRREIRDCHNNIESIFGYSCKGLRLPGYYFDDGIASTLDELGYQYDSSVLPGTAVYLMSAFYRLLNPSGAGKRFGRNLYLFARRSPYRIGDRCWELPLATCPIFGTPVHSTFVFQWGTRYLRTSMALSRALRSHMVYLFHAIDLLDGQNAGPLQRSVGTLRVPLAARLHAMKLILGGLTRGSVLPTGEFLARLTAQARA